MVTARNAQYMKNAYDFLGRDRDMYAGHLP